MTDQIENAITPWTDEELRRKVGQLFIVGFHGHEPSEDIKTLITTYHVGTIILFLRNVASASQLLSLTTSLQTIAKAANHTQDLFIAIDQENGLVTRIKSPVAAQLPGSMALAATGDAENALKIANATAETLRAFGINMNYAPIADVNSEPKNPVIGVRSPSDDPETVGRFVAAQVKGLSEGGILPCAKHFPGHGDTAVDSHYGLPIIGKSKAELEGCELVPFRRAVAEGIEAIMTAHIAMPGIGDQSRVENDPGRTLPASLNPDAIKILREEMKFDGLIVSDCLEMDGVRATFGTENGAVMALKAGTDTVMICHTIEAQIGAIEKVVEAVKAGALSQKAIQASVDRVTRLKTKYAQTGDLEQLKSLSISGAEERDTRQAALAAEIYAKSTTLVRSEPGVIPISFTSNSKIVFVSPGKTPVGGGAVESGEEKTREPWTPAAYIDLIRAHSPEAVDVRFHDGFELSAEDEKSINEADIIIYATRNASLSPYQKHFGLSLGKKYSRKLIVIATCDPYDFLEEKAEILNYITIYEPTIPAFKAAIDVIFGVIKPQGRLPVGSPGTKHDIQVFTGSDSDIDHISKLWDTIFPTWPFARERLASILTNAFSPGRHFVHEKGFCISFLSDGSHGKVAVVGVLQEYRNKGLGTAFISTAREALKEAAGGTLQSFAIGSVFPRFWPGVPVEFPQEVKDFFVHRGFRKGTGPTVLDFYADISGAIATPGILAKVEKMNLKFSPWSPELYDELMAKQKKLFGWWKAYEGLAAYNQHHEALVAFDGTTGEQVAWTLMCSPSGLMSNFFAFIPATPSGEATGLIGAVGVDDSVRGNGVGLALMVKAMENLKERGVKGVLVDMAIIRGFYEKLGFGVWKEYGEYSW